MFVAKDATNVTLPCITLAFAGSWWDLQWLDWHTLILMKKCSLLYCFALPFDFQEQKLGKDYKAGTCIGLLYSFHF
jgi:hypothetical protein